MTAQVSPEGGEAQGPVTSGSAGAGAGPRTGPGARTGAGATSGPGAEAGAGRGREGEEAWDDIVLDEDFVRTAGTAEPSARARMLAARWRQEAPDPQPWRSDEPPAGWLFSKARRRRWRRR